jgi:hypothetical protein
VIGRSERFGNARRDRADRRRDDHELGGLHRFPEAPRRGVDRAELDCDRERARIAVETGDALHTGALRGQPDRGPHEPRPDHRHATAATRHRGILA